MGLLVQLCILFYTINENDVESLKIKELYEKRRSIVDVITYNGEYNKTKYVGLEIDKDDDLISRIQESFDKLRNELHLKMLACSC